MFNGRRTRCGGHTRRFFVVAAFYLLANIRRRCPAVIIVGTAHRSVRKSYYLLRIPRAYLRAQVISSFDNMKSNGEEFIDLTLELFQLTRTKAT